jgi:predicted XRE-type DNA-binding protein
LLGETSRAGGTSGGGSSVNQGGTDVNGNGDHNLEGISAKAQNWMKQNQLTMAQVERLFDVGTDGVTVIASEAPGKHGKDKTINAYVLQGVSRFLASGDAVFDDKDARKVCEHFGCYDNTNHAARLDEKGNLFTGSKSTGWKITAPGLKHGADLIKQLTKEG